MTTLTLDHQCPQCSEPVYPPSQEHEDIRFCPKCQLPLVIVAGKYEIEKRLSEGGCGVLYLARHQRLRMDPIRVIKFLKPELFKDETADKRFAREVEITAAISQRNEHIVRVYDDFGHIKQLGHYFVMELLQGAVLSELLEEKGDLPILEIFHIFRQLCQAIQVAHEAEVVHRDLKPDNVFVISRGDEENFVKVIDFGIAKTTQQQTALTQGAIGTPEYMSPEQCTAKPVDHRSDIYSLGIILFEMIIGYTPFLPPGSEANASLMYLVFAQISNPPPVPSELRKERGITPELDAFILKMLEKNPDARPQDIPSVLRELDEVERSFQSPVDTAASGPREGEPRRQAITKQLSEEELQRELAEGEGRPVGGGTVQYGVPATGIEDVSPSKPPLPTGIGLDSAEPTPTRDIIEEPIAAAVPVIQRVEVEPVVQKSTIAPDTALQQPEPEKKSSLQLPVILVLVLALLGGGGVVGMKMFGGKPQKRSEIRTTRKAPARTTPKNRERPEPLRVERFPERREPKARGTAKVKARRAVPRRKTRVRNRRYRRRRKRRPIRVVQVRRRKPNIKIVKAPDTSVKGCPKDTANGRWYRIDMFPKPRFGVRIPYQNKPKSFGYCVFRGKGEGRGKIQIGGSYQVCRFSLVGRKRAFTIRLKKAGLTMEDNFTYCLR